jgi:hypothetical protein
MIEMLEAVYLLDLTGYSILYKEHVTIKPKMKCEKGLKDV